MSDITVGIICTFGLGWVAWISVTVINLLRSNNSGAVTDLKKSFGEMETRVTSALDKVNLRQDNFMKTEIQELKSIIQNAKDG